ncbi:MAG: competence/damage-inducible protein A [Phycisphaerales bacterium]|nr:competence/damage-inducible protein A [Phycisphaerales bacterium]
MRAYILSIGDELISGLTVNTNAGWLAERLTELGIQAVEHVTVGDDLMWIVSATKEAIERVREDGVGGIVLMTGGLGPTEDDLTRQGLAAALNEELIEDPEAVLQIEAWFKSKGRIMSPSNRSQALRPRSAVCIENTDGTAPGLRVERDGVSVFVMPGVPREMREMFQRSVLPELKKKAGEVMTRTTKINTCGLGESLVGERIKDLMTRGGGGSGELLVGTTAHDGIVSVRIYATGRIEETLQMTERVRQVVLERLGEFVFSEGEQTLDREVGRLLLATKQTVAAAESCTGGLLAKCLTDLAGASGYFMRGWVTYANEAKEQELGVAKRLIETHGAVSEEVVRAMAEGARTRAETDFALAITGIAGPEGGSNEKPVGTVWIALAAKDRTLTRRYIFPGNREIIRLRAAQMALAMLRWKLLGVEGPE